MPSAKKPANAGLDNGLYPPRLDRLVLPEDRMAGAGPDYSAILETICGAVDDSQPVEQYDGTLGVTTAFVNAHQAPAVQVQWNSNLAAVFTNPGDVSGVRWGSGTMIGPDLFLTCGHLFDQDPNGWTIPRQNGTSNAITPQQAAQQMHLNFNYQVDAGGVLQTEVSYPITQLLEYRLGGLDMALCRIGGSPGNTYGWTEFSTTNAAVGDMLAIIGHPAGQPKRIEAGPTTSIVGSTIGYNDIDTLGGNSGSGILQASTGRVVGVHTNGGCNPQGTGQNTGTAIAAIVAASPTLQATTPSSSTGLGLDFTGTPLSVDIGGTLAGHDTANATDTGVLKDFATPLAQDIHVTTKAADVGTPMALDTQVAQDQIATFLQNDTQVAADQGTSVALDHFDTPISADVLTTVNADQVGTAFIKDQPGTPFGFDTGLADQPGTFVGGDDPGFDPGTVINPVINPVVNPVFPGLSGLLGGGQRPFVQAGPYTPVDEGIQVPNPVLAELEALIVTQTQVLASLQALYRLLASGEL
jgi:V8-like Glu-specific endopeptidase